MAITVSNPGQSPGGSANELYYKEFAGLVLAAFTASNVTEGKFLVRRVPRGAKSASFPVLGKFSADYLSRGASLFDTGGILGEIEHNQRDIFIDLPLIAATFVHDIDTILSAYDVRAAYAKQLGRQLAESLSDFTMRVGLLGAAQTTALVSGGGVGTTITNTNAGTNASDLAAAILDAKDAMDSQNVPEENRYCFLTPQAYNLLLDGSAYINTDYNADGDMGKGVVRRLFGFELVSAPNLPTSNLTTPSTGPMQTYTGDFSNTVAWCTQEEGVGQAIAAGPDIEEAYIAERDGYLVKAKIAQGVNWLRPECNVRIKTL